MARNFNSDGKLILADLSMEEKVDIILEFWNFLEEVHNAFYAEFDGEHYDDEDDEDFSEAIEKLGQGYMWTFQGDNNDTVSFGGLDFHVWGRACVAGYISSEEDWDQRVSHWLVSKNSRSNAKGLYRELYAKANPNDPNLPLSESEKQFEGWNREPFVWTRPCVKCPFCEPLDDQSPVKCPVDESKLDHLSYEHEWTQSFALEDGF